MLAIYTEHSHLPNSAFLNPIGRFLNDPISTLQIFKSLLSGRDLNLNILLLNLEF